MTEPPSASAVPSLDRRHVYLGGYTAPEGGSRGVQSFQITGSDSAAVSIRELPAVEVTSPSYLVAHPTLPILYAVSETSPSQVHRLTLAADGSARWQESLELSGQGACHLALDETARFLVVAHYLDGSVSSVALTDEGALGEEVSVRRFSGSGPVTERQVASHAHQVVFANGALYVVDLGGDQVHHLHLTPEGGLEVAADPLALPAGCGPRHLVCDGEVLVIAAELSAELLLARRSATGWTLRSRIPTTATSTTETFPSALIQHDGRYLVANRGADTVAAFGLGDGEDTLRALGEVSSHGRWPRDLVAAEGRLWVAHQRSDALTVFANAGETPDRWTLDFEVPTPSPACIVVLP